MDLVMAEIKSNSVLRSVLETAYKNEIYLYQGQNFGPDLLFRAKIDDDSGLWVVDIETLVGNLRVGELGENFFLISSCNILGLEKQYLCNFSSSEEIRLLKQALLQDEVCLNVVIDSFENRSLAELFPIMFRNFKQELKNYQKKYSFLWEATGHKNARSLYADICG